MSTTFSIRRFAGLARWNATLLMRNRLTLGYATVLPLLPLLLLLVGDRGDVGAGAGSITTLFLIAGLFPVFYNVLAQFVSRRDELVLKRLRTGEVRDGELLASIAFPGVVCALLVLALAVPLAALLGQPLPVNPIVYAVGAVAVVVMFAAFAYWTAAWTKNAEAAQLTSLPIILLASLGPLGVSLQGASDVVRDIIAITPGAAMGELVRIGWFGFDGIDATTTTLSFADTWGQALQPLVVIAVWTVLALDLARRSIRWEPRA